MSGEFAGYALDESIDAENERWLYRQGIMSDSEAYDLGIIDHNGEYNHVPMFRKSNLKTCSHCGASGLIWMNVSGAWRLGSGGKVHTCQQYTKSANKFTNHQQ